MRTSMISLLVIGWSLMSPATAAASDHLDGTYVLDPEASDDPTPMMELMGMGGVQTAIAKKMKTKMVFDGEPDQVTITLKAPIGKNTTVMPTDGSTIEREGGEFGSGKSTAYWEDDGRRFVVVSDSQTKDGKKLHTVTSRFLEDEDTLIQQFEITVEGADPITLRRVFRRH